MVGSPIGGALTRHAFLDGWRALAIVGVLIDHYVTARPINLGRFGVEMFFVLSGLLMADILFVRRMELPTFFWRRGSRVYPALIVFLVAMMVLVALGLTKITPVQFAAAFTFTYNYVQIWGGGRAAFIDHIWTLCIEEHTYLVLALVAVLTRRSPVAGALVCLALAAAAWANGLIQTLLGGDYYVVYWRSDVRGASILLGAAAYLLLRSVKVPTWTPVLLAVAAVALNFNSVPDPLKYSVGTACLAGVVVFLAQAPKVVVGALSSRPMALFGLWSFSTYLWQQPFSRIAPFPSNLVWVAAAVVVAFMSYTLVENPARAYLNRLREGFGARRATSEPRSVDRTA